MKRQIIKIDYEKCDGCGGCIPECKEGALQIIDGKARLVSDLFCDGLGACLGSCPQNAIIIEEREAEPYDERKVLENIILEPPNVLKAHLQHLISHKAFDHYETAKHFLVEKNIKNPFTSLDNNMNHSSNSGCPGSKMVAIDRQQLNITEAAFQKQVSALEQWPIQLHLVNPDAPYFKGKELLIMSTCAPVASAEIHQAYLPGRSIVMACPKLDYTEPYTEKLAMIFSQSRTPKAIVVIMEVPCCRGLSKFALDAARISGRKDIIVEEHILSLEGELKSKNVIYGLEKVMAQV